MSEINVLYGYNYSYMEFIIYTEQIDLFIYANMCPLHLFSDINTIYQMEMVQDS